MGGPCCKHGSAVYNYFSQCAYNLRNQGAVHFGDKCCQWGGTQTGLVPIVRE